MLERYFGRDHVLRRIQENPICEQIKLLVEYLDDRGHPKVPSKFTPQVSY